jgi:hypothetical protein
MQQDVQMKYYKVKKIKFIIQLPYWMLCGKMKIYVILDHE